MMWPEIGKGSKKVFGSCRCASRGEPDEYVGWLGRGGEELRERGLHSASERIPHGRTLCHLLRNYDCSAADCTLSRCGNELEQHIAFPRTIAEQAQDVALGVEASAAWEHALGVLLDAHTLAAFAAAARQHGPTIGRGNSSTKTMHAGVSSLLRLVCSLWHKDIFWKSRPSIPADQPTVNNPYSFHTLSTLHPLSGYFYTACSVVPSENRLVEPNFDHAEIRK
jgi:hypothetical protein